MKQKSKPPVSKGQVIELNIEGISHDGSGVGRFEGFTIFVPETAPGDVVTARVISLQKNHARALVEAVNQRSSNRADPPCEYYRRCGGCQLQHIDYAKQLILKENMVRDALLRIGGLDTDVLPVTGMEEPWNYRNKTQVPVGHDGQNIMVGFYEKRSHKIVDIESCLIQHPANNRAVSAVRSALQDSGIPVYNKEKHTGIIRHILARTSFSTGEILVVLVTNGRSLPDGERLVSSILAGVEGVTGIVQNINRARGNVILGKEDITLWGKPYLTEEIGGYTFNLSPRSFFQVNPSQVRTLYGLISEFAGLTGRETVFDLYCGTGTIALYLSKKAKKVIGIESGETALEDARKNAGINRVDNAEFYEGTAERVLPELINKGYQADLIIVDPPRRGCDKELLESMLQAAPGRIIYVSCNPATLARDLRQLTSGSYIIQKVRPVDMFPHTSHVETIVLMTRQEERDDLSVLPVVN